MSKWLDPHSFAGRFLSFFIVLAIPLLRHLVRLRYEIWRPEVWAALAVLALPCLALAWLTRMPRLFYSLLTLWIAIFATSSLYVELFSGWPWIAVFAGLIVAIGAAAAIFRERLPLLMALALGGMLGAETVLMMTTGGWLSDESELRLDDGRPPRHRIHLILDEQTGLAGFPAEIPECAGAARAWSGMLERYGFTIYPNAFSNYNETWYSLPSILNDQLLRVRGRYRLERNMFAGNSLFAAASARGLELAVYQSDYMRYNIPRYRYAVVREYDSSDISALLSASTAWTDRTWRILVWYVLMDRLFASYVRIWAPGIAMGARVAPLATRKVWPQAILQDVFRARASTLFFVHLLNPHHPYVFDVRGNVRPTREWRSPVAYSKDEYVKNYVDYCGQSTFLARQLDEFFGRLQDEGILENTQVVLHGDHGSRIRIASSPAAALDPDQILPAHPTARELLDSYSAMLAIRQPGASQPRTDTTKSSLLYLIRKYDGRAGDADLNNVYLVDEFGAIGRSIPILDIWKD